MSSARFSPKYSRQCEQQVGGRVAAEQVAQPAKLVGVLLVEEDRLEVQPVQQHEPAEAVGLLDRLGVSPEPIDHAGDQVAILPGGRLVLVEQAANLGSRSAGCVLPVVA